MILNNTKFYQNQHLPLKTVPLQKVVPGSPLRSAGGEGTCVNWEGGGGRESRGTQQGQRVDLEINEQLFYYPVSICWP